MRLQQDRTVQIGVFTSVLRAWDFEHVLDFVAALGVQAVEIGVGAYASDSHCPVDELLQSARKTKAFLESIHSRRLRISALSCHGNPLHPNRKIADAHDLAFRKAVRLARKLQVDVLNTFSGCPGDHSQAKQPNWVTCAWPAEYREVLLWQWEKVAVPYWKRAAAFASRHGLRKIAIEMHPGFLVYNPETLLKLRKAIGPEIGTNFDPSHLFWQGIDPCAAIRAMPDAIYHVHLKDTAIHHWNSSVNGVLDSKPYHDERHRSWIFRTIGYGNPRSFWCDFVSALRMAGYDGALSIEHEDPLLAPTEGLEKGIRFLHSILFSEPKEGDT